MTFAFRRLFLFAALACLLTAPALATEAARGSASVDPQLKAEMQALQKQIKRDAEAVKAALEPVKVERERLKTNRAKMRALREKAKAQRQAAHTPAGISSQTPTSDSKKP